jgi:hypothetical protein
MNPVVMYLRTVTSVSISVGYGIAVHLLQHSAAKIVLPSHLEDRANAAIEHLKTHGDTSRVVWHQCNFWDLKQTDTLARELRSEYQRNEGVRAAFQGLVIFS